MSGRRMQWNIFPWDVLINFIPFEDTVRLDLLDLLDLLVRFATSPIFQT